MKGYTMKGKRGARVVDDPAVIAALNESVRKLQQGVDMHCCLVNAITQNTTDAGHLSTMVRERPKRSREKMLTDALKEAIHVIEESRKAFKSRQLETLRKRLTCVLMETD